MRIQPSTGHAVHLPIDYTLPAVIGGGGGGGGFYSIRIVRVKAKVRPSIMHVDSLPSLKYFPSACIKIGQDLLPFTVGPSTCRTRRLCDSLNT